MDPDELRHQLVAHVVARGAARSPTVVGALRAVPRHLFLSHLPVETAYADRSIALAAEGTTTVSSASQPSMIAEMLEQLAVRPGDRVLEIGTGSGYNAALLGYLCGPDGIVVTIDLDGELVERARVALDRAGFERVRTLHRDGAEGVAELAPFDRIILTVAADDILDPWRAQLAPGGRLVLPLALRALQESIAFEGNDPLHSLSIVGASFVTLRGTEAAAAREIDLGSYPAIRLRVRDSSIVDVRKLDRLLREPAAATELEGIKIDDLWSGLDLWLDAHVADAALATASGEGDGAYVGAWLSVSRDERFATTLCACDGDALVLLVRDREGRIGLMRYGRTDALVERIRAASREWIERGRPATHDLEIAAHARTTPETADALIVKPSVTLALRWN